MQNQRKNTTIELGDTAMRKRKFLEMFEEYHGIIEVAARAAGISRPTYYNWRRSDPEFNVRCMEILEQQGDFVEDILIKQIHDGSEAQVRYYLSHMHARYKNSGNLPNNKLQNNEQPITLEQLLDGDPLTALNQDEHATNERAANTPFAENQNQAGPDSTIPA